MFTFNRQKVTWKAARVSSYTPFYKAIFSHGQARKISHHLYKLFIPVVHRTQENNCPKKGWYADLKQI